MGIVAGTGLGLPLGFGTHTAVHKFAAGTAAAAVVVVDAVAESSYQSSDVLVVSVSASVPAWNMNAAPSVGVCRTWTAPGGVDRPGTAEHCC